MTILGQFIKLINDPKMDVFAPSPPLPFLPQAACFFSQSNSSGQVFCLGLGDRDLSNGQKNSIQSLRVYDGATAYAFVETGYADNSETAITTDNADLKSRLYSTSKNLPWKIEAFWIKAGT